MADFGGQTSEWPSTEQSVWDPRPGQQLVTIGVIVNYKMRRKDSGASSGVVYWLNTSGDAEGSPAPIGVQGPVSIEASWS